LKCSVSFLTKVKLEIMLVYYFVERSVKTLNEAKYYVSLDQLSHIQNLLQRFIA
jgi:hypothetical protein